MTTDFANFPISVSEVDPVSDMAGFSTALETTRWDPSRRTSGQLKLINGNLINSSPNVIQLRSTRRKTTGKWYVEFFGVANLLGVATGQYDLRFVQLQSSMLTSPYSWSFYAAGQAINNGADLGLSIPTFSGTDILGLELDMDARTLQLYINGVAGGSPITELPSPLYILGNMSNAPAANYVNFGRKPFTYPLRADFLAYDPPPKGI